MMYFYGTPNLKTYVISDFFINHCPVLTQNNYLSFSPLFPHSNTSPLYSNPFFPALLSSLSPCFVSLNSLSSIADSFLCSSSLLFVSSTFLPVFNPFSFSVTAFTRLTIHASAVSADSSSTAYTVAQLQSAQHKHTALMASFSLLRSPFTSRTTGLLSGWPTNTTTTTRNIALVQGSTPEELARQCRRLS